jgi:hypothetical protein
MVLYCNRYFQKLNWAVWLAVLGVALSGPAARAGDDAPSDDSLVKKTFKLFCFATDPQTPQDFVVETRPAVKGDYVPVGRKPLEHPIKVKTPDELKAMQADFDAVKAAHDVLRSNFPPSAQAVAAAEAAKAAKANQPKKPRPATAPQ